MSTASDRVPQGLKPNTFSQFDGTAKAVPSHDSAVESEHEQSGSEIREVVRQKYGEAALRVKLGGSSCCGLRFKRSARFLSGCTASDNTCGQQ